MGQAVNEATLLARVQAHLDARRDPLDDGEVVAFLDEHPESLALLTTVAALRADARALAALPVPRVRRWPLALGAAALLAAVGAAVAVCHDTSDGASAGRIVDARLEEIRPRAHAAATLRVVEPLAHTTTARLETWQVRSEPR